MNDYYVCLDTIWGILKECTEIHTIIHGGTGELDTYKKSIPPIAHINPISRDFASSQMNSYTFEIAILDQRNISKFQEEDKFAGNDNEIDNLNLCDYALNFLITSLRNRRTGIELISVGSASPLILKHTNLMDGWVLQITVATQNDIINPCNP